MKKLFLTLLIISFSAGVFAQSKDDLKYRVEMKTLVDNVIDYAQQIAYLAGVDIPSDQTELIDIIKFKVSDIVVESMEPLFRKQFTYKDLKAYNKMMKKKAVQKFNNGLPLIIVEILNDKQWQDSFEEALKRELESAFMQLITGMGDMSEMLVEPVL